MSTTPDVYLGFADDETALNNEDFPDTVNGKIGGKPIWLEPKHLPSLEKLLCESCKNPLSFLLQIYAPYEKSTNAYHRTVYVFCCKNGTCHANDFKGRFKVVRCQLPKENKFYIFDNEKEAHKRSTDFHKFTTPLCDVCGLMGPHVCSACKSKRYCSREHQRLDWTLGHKQECNGNQSKATTEHAQPEPTTDATATAHHSVLFPELELVTELEEDVQEKEDDAEILEKAKKAEDEKDEEVDEAYFQVINKDKEFLRFQRVTKAFPDQVLRYYGWDGAKPLSVSSNGEPKTSDIPKCSCCGSERIAEFQIMPQMLYRLKVDSVEQSLDWGILTVFTCSKSCNVTDEKDVYAEEFIWRQNFSQ